MPDEKKVEAGKEPKAELSTDPLFHMEPGMPDELPDESWSTERLARAVTGDRNMLARSNAVSYLANRQEPEAVEAMVQALKDDEHIVKSNAMVRLAARGKGVVDRMIAALEDADDGIRAGSAWVLGEIKDGKAVEGLKKAAEDESLLVRAQAKASLMAMGVLKQKEPENK
ncbi:MAG: HEAT repeat domain-containing protein [Methanosarcinales archaeon]|nr:HEAT repeat domain-containing protein [Methanosarcinales archaeon]